MEQVHGGVSRNVAEDIANVELRPTFVGLVDETVLKKAVLQKPAQREVVLTGREPADWMLAAADYCTEMQCRRHPYEKGIAAREGVEY